MSRGREADLVARTGADLEADGWTVYYEVSAGQGCARADVVASRLGVLLIVEAKMSLTMDVLGQAQEWLRRGAAHRVAVVVPATKRSVAWDWSSGRRLAYRVAEWLGLGVATMPLDRPHGSEHLSWVVAPRTHARAPGVAATRDLLHEGLKMNDPGQGARYWTPFRETVRRLEAWVAANPGSSIKGAVAGMEEHHYANDRSARQCLLDAVHRGLVSRVEIRAGEGGALTLWPRAQEPGTSPPPRP